MENGNYWIKALRDDKTYEWVPAYYDGTWFKCIIDGIPHKIINPFAVGNEIKSGKRKDGFYWILPNYAEGETTESNLILARWTSNVFVDLNGRKYPKDVKIFDFLDEDMEKY